MPFMWGHCSKSGVECEENAPEEARNTAHGRGPRKWDTVCSPRPIMAKRNRAVENGVADL